MEFNLLLASIGILFFSLGIFVRIGVWKSWYWRKRHGMYGYIPLGLLFILYSLNQFVVGQSVFIFVLYIALFILCLILVVLLTLKPPHWIKPSWVQWIEKHPQSTIQSMIDAISRGEEWGHYVRDEKSVDNWADLLPPS